MVLLFSAFLFVLAFFWPLLLLPANILMLFLSIYLLIEALLLWQTKQGVQASRTVARRLSNGDDNPVGLEIANQYPVHISLKVIDELPIQFQRRDFALYHHQLASQQSTTLSYTLRPTERGLYQFGNLHLNVSIGLGLISRHYCFVQPDEVAVYPSFAQVHKYELLAISNKLSEAGIKKIRRIGQNREFEQIKDYVQGDDIRSINWKATARRNQLMVNHYQDEKSQQIYCLIDKGRNMRQPFNGMTLLDYAINSALVLANIAVMQYDQPGLLTFRHQIDEIVPATRGRRQMQKFLETLYKQETGFEESDYQRLFIQVRQLIKQRSLLVLFTNFESLHTLQRALPALRQLAKTQVLLVVMFENTAINSYITRRPRSLEELYNQTVAEQFVYEKRLIVRELNKYGIYTVLSHPNQLTAAVINEYLALKAKGVV